MEKEDKEPVEIYGESVLSQEGVGAAESVHEAIVAAEEVESDRYIVREIQFLGQIKRILLQNMDETSSLVSIANALALKGELDFNAQHYEPREMHTELLRILPDDVLLDFDKLASYKPKPILGSVAAFVEDACLQIFRKLHLPLYHGRVDENVENSLVANIAEHEIAVLFHGETFSTVTKHGESMYLLITELLGEDENSVWQGLDNVKVGGDFQLLALEGELKGLAFEQGLDGLALEGDLQGFAFEGWLEGLAQLDFPANLDSSDSDNSMTTHDGGGEHLSPRSVLSGNSDSGNSDSSSSSL